MCITQSVGHLLQHTPFPKHTLHWSIDWNEATKHIYQTDLFHYPNGLASISWLYLWKQAKPTRIIPEEKQNPSDRPKAGMMDVPDLRWWRFLCRRLWVLKQPLDGRRQVRGNERYVEAANYVINIHKSSYDMYMLLLLLLLLLPLLLRRLRLKRLLPLLLQASTKTERHDINGSTSSTGEYCPSSPACGTGFSISPWRVFFAGVAATFPPPPQKKHTFENDWDRWDNYFPFKGFGVSL